MTNIYKARHNERKKIICNLFKNNYINYFDDFYEARDQLFEDISEVFQDEYDVRFKSLALDDITDSSGLKIAMKELSKKL